MRGFFRGVAAAISILAASVRAPARAEDDPLVLQPSSPWHIDYADDSCRLARSFGSGEERSIFIIERYEPGDSFFLIAAGAPLDARPSSKLEFTFGPDGDHYEGPSQIGDLGDDMPAVMTTGMRLVADPEASPDSHRKRHEKTADELRQPDIFGQDITPEQEASINWLEVQGLKQQPVRLALGSMGPPMAAMRKCTDELLTHWGIDVIAHRALTRAVEPKGKPGNWMTWTDYPHELMDKGAQGIVQFRLSVDAEGEPTQCHIQKSTRPEGFDKAVCNALMRRAHFEPALGADGRPIASYWRSTVRFQMPR